MNGEHRHEIEKKSSLVILAALLIHIGFCTIFFISDWHAPIDISNAHVVSFDTPIVFQDDPEQDSPASAYQQPPAQESWGSMTARHSTFGTPDQGEDMPVPATITQSMATTSDESTDGSPDGNAETAGTAMENLSSTMLVDTTISTDTLPPQKPFKKALLRPQKFSDKQVAATKQLASFSKGYLEQLHTNGENLVTMTGGDPNKRATAEQLKHQRYWAKIQWALQNAFKINADRYQPTKEIHTQARVFLSIDRKGSMHDLTVIQSSGIYELDAFIRYLFNYIGDELPPLPHYLNDPYPMTWIIQIDIGPTSRWAATLY